MSVAIKPEYNSSAETICLKITESGQKQEKILQNKSEKRACFRTSERYSCKETECGCWNECKKLVAVWLR